MMRHVAIRLAFRGLNAGFALIISLLVVHIFSPVHANASATITNLAQFRPALALEDPVIADLDFDAIVFSCDTNAGVLILQNSGDTELLEVDELSDTFH